MSNLSFDKHLTEPAARLALAAPQQWEAFITAFKAHAEARLAQLVMAPRDDLEKIQGRAQECVHLVTTFDEAVASAKKAALQRDEKASR